MKVTIKYLAEFERKAKYLDKKYKSFRADFAALLTEVEENPFQGVSLGGGVYKIRMRISSKGKGKSGGARVLTYTVSRTEEDTIIVKLLTIFDKNEMENVSNSYIEQLLILAKRG